MNYFLITENKGKSLGFHTEIMHELINDNIIQLNSYKKHCQSLFNQIYSTINWLHNTAKVSYLNINLQSSYAIFIFHSVTICHDYNFFSINKRLFS